MFLVYLPDGDLAPYRLVTVERTTTVLDVLCLLLNKDHYGSRVDWVDSPVLYCAPNGLASGPPEEILARTKSWLLTSPPAMEEFKVLDDYFPQVLPASQQIHLVLVHQRIALGRKINFNTVVAPRHHLVTFLYETTRDQEFFFVKSTPGSGKSTLAHLLYNHITNLGEECLVLDNWEEKETLEASFKAACKYGDVEKGYFDYMCRVDGKRRWLLFDEGQTTYADNRLWSSYIKDPPPNVYVVVFALYARKHSDVDIIGIPNNIQHHETMCIMPTENGLRPEKTHIPGLYFLRAEYDGLLESRKGEQDLPQLADDLSDWIFQMSNGHIGAIDSIVATIKLYAKEPRILSLDTFMAKFNSPSQALAACVHGCDRGIPNNEAIQAPANQLAVTFVMDLLLSAPRTYSSSDLPDGAMRAHHLGWIVLDEVNHTGMYEVRFPSPIHQSRVSWLIHGCQALDPRIQGMTLVQFVIAVVRHFSGKALREPECHNSSIPEAQYQNELYRAAWKVTGGHGIWLSPECGTSTPIDFYVSDPHNWGIEVMREGDRIEEHLRRFSPGGTYHTWIQKGTMKECVILDFTIKTTAQKRFNFPNNVHLFHVSFMDDFHKYRVSDCDLKVLEEGLLVA